MGRLGCAGPLWVNDRPVSNWQLAQITMGRLIARHDDAYFAGFFAELNRMKALADASPGLVWRSVGDDGNAPIIQPTPGPQFIVNMPVWTDAEALFAIVYRNVHTQVMAKRRQWFERSDTVYLVFWWVAAGTRSTIGEGHGRLDRLRPAEQAFTFKADFPAPDRPGAAVDMNPDPWCAGRA
jgi:hypothetical protein